MNPEQTVMHGWTTVKELLILEALQSKKALTFIIKAVHVKFLLLNGSFCAFSKSTFKSYSERQTLDFGLFVFI